jgi:hypothetical protein
MKEWKKLAMKTANTINVKTFKSVGVAVTVAVGLLVSAVSSHAQILNLTGGTVEGDLTNQELVGVGMFPAGNLGANNGSISSWVVSDSALDPTGLIFVYQALNNGFDAIDQVELTGFMNSQVVTTATYSGLSGLLLPLAVTPNASGNFTSEDTFGDTATFEGGELPNGNSPSYYLVVFTDASAFTTSYGQIQDDFTAIGNTLAPAAVPEPSSSVVLLAGLGCLYGVLKLRRNTKLKAQKIS